MAGLFDIEEDGQSFGYELPEDTFTQPGSTWLDMGTFSPTAEDIGSVPSILPTSEDLAFSTLDLGGFDYKPEDDGQILPTTPADTSVFSEWFDKLGPIAKTLGLTNKDGSYDWGKIIGMGAAGLTLNDTLNQSAQPVKTTQQLLAGVPSNTPAGFSPGALTAMSRPMQAGNQLARQYAADMPSSIRDGGRGYAEGGEVEDIGAGALSQTFDSARTQGYVDEGEGGGQDDMIAARLSPGEYVFDAESVSMLGDGDNAAGARKLDELREVMRAHKRSAPADEIAPKSLGPLSYMNGGLNA